ncbi:hypothetical protein [Haloarcula nitratireducens]|uniref:Uncharacterized protein n=1 Tax=Haloarcula nitratireducens TaxID=2487749 RepID=A0AAW4P7Z0_9EURY|nr:hypothetical protein [Halomicroarcula nitratireducens]MBX0294001.1 hypothetical protein [Halomicroarcula nitratireducens]
MPSTDTSLDFHLEAALAAAEDETTLYHLRQAMQLRIAENEDVTDERPGGPLSA